MEPARLRTNARPPPSPGFLGVALLRVCAGDLTNVCLGVIIQTAVCTSHKTGAGRRRASARYGLGDRKSTCAAGAFLYLDNIRTNCQTYFCERTLLFKILASEKPGLSEEIPGLLEQNDRFPLVENFRMWYNYLARTISQHHGIVSAIEGMSSIGVVA